MKTIGEWKHNHKREAEILELCKNIVRKVVPKSVLILFGSRARETSAPDSDIDILILTEKPPNKTLVKKIRSQIFEIELEKDIIIDTLCYERNLWDSPQYRALPIHELIEREGIVI